MAFCLAELHLWSAKSSLQVTDTDIGTYQYHEKGEPVTHSECHYYNEKQHFSETRGYSWTPKNRRPEKLRDSLKELEELLQTSACVHARWKNKHCCQLMLSTGILVTLTLNGPQLERVCVDRTLLGRLPADTVTDAVITDRLLLLSFLEKSQVCAVFLNKKNHGSPETGRRVEKLSSSELKVVCADLRGGSPRRLGRRVGLNCLQDVAVCWWPLVSSSSAELWPWTPTSHTHTDRANLLLLSCSATDGLKVLSSIRTEGDPLDCHFSLLQPYQLLSVEVPEGPHPESQGPEGASSADACAYECARGRLQRLSVTRIPLSSRPVSCARHPSETSLLLGLADSSLVLYDQQRGVPLLAPCPVPPSLLAWHPAGAVAAAGGGQGELMFFDVGLAPLGVALLAEEAAPAATLRLAQHLRCPGGLEGLYWGGSVEGGADGTDLLMIAFHSGPLAALRFRLGALTGGQLGSCELLQQRLRCGQVDQALGILGAMEWSTMGSECYHGLSSVTEHLLRLELDAEREAQLEAALGVFYAPPSPLSDTVVLEYRDPISKYARRFFHHLLRHQRFEKAFLLAVDIGARDLFMDLHYVASDKGEVVLAAVAKRKANEIAVTVMPGAEESPANLRGRNGLCGSRTTALQTDRNLVATGPPSQRNLCEEPRRQQPVASTPVTVSAAPNWPWTNTENSLANQDENENEDTGTLKVVHFGLV
ncbi:WD repeat-containing and planar cell polarity effector protein fritz homolog [Osmerus eperlanus]|uniref:WD repeat-containing and planar cell polarity effector protein fritz homolog n=1 Tax=Osmerus eperlanus TaxID=29151 RepID=UPI002E12023E